MNEKNVINFNTNNNPNRNSFNKMPSYLGSKNHSRKNSIYNDSNNNSISNITPKVKDNNFINQKNSKSLLKNIQYLDEENNKLRELLSELNTELKEKEEALNESQKIIFKLKDEYSQMMKEYKKLENEKNRLFERNENNQKIFDNMSKKQIEYEKIIKQNELLKQELVKIKGNINYYKSNFSNITNDLNKLEKNNKAKELLIKDLKIEGDKCVNMLQDRELLIETYSKKINELNQIIKQKNEQLKLMVNFSKEINNENKSNVKELTMQAVKTIKVFYNTLNNKDNKNQVNFLEIRNTKPANGVCCSNNANEVNCGNNMNPNDVNLVLNLFDNKLNSQKCSMYLTDSLKDLLYIPDEGVNYINKEFLIDNNFKTCLLKTELFCSLIREYNLYNFFKDIFGKLDIAITYETGIHDKLRKMNDFKFQFDQMKTAFDVYSKENISLKNKLNDLHLYIDKLKRDFDKKNQKYKKKIEELFNLVKIYEDYLDGKNDKNNLPNNIQKLKDEVSALHLQIDKINNDNHNLNDKILEKDKIIDSLKDEVDRLNSKINALRTNPSSENIFNVVEKNENFTQTDIVDYNNVDKNNNLERNNIKINNNEISKSLELTKDKILNGSSSPSKNKIERPKYYLSSLNKKLEIQPRERFTYNLITTLKKNNNSFLNNITPIKDRNNNYNDNNFSDKIFNDNNSKDYNFNNNIRDKILKDNNYNNKKNYINNKINDENNMNVNNITSINNNINELNSFSKLTNIDNILEAQQNSELIGSHENMNNNYQSFFIDDFKKEINENNFMDVARKNVGISKVFSVLTSKVEQVKNVILSVKEKLKKMNKDKKISPRHVSQVLTQIEKYLSYIFIHLNRSNGELLSILPSISIIYNLISKFVYNKSFKFFPDSNINYYNYNINSLQIDNPIEDINIESSNNSTSKESLLPNIQELKQFFDINKKIFSTSELIKYRNIYNNLPMSQIINVFKETCNNLKKTINNLRISYKNSASDYSDFDETITSKFRNQQGFTADCDDYRIVNEKILKLKKFEFDFKILMELLKNYLVCFEIIVKKIEKELQIKNKSNLVQLGEEINIIFNLFEDVIYYKMDELDDDTIFNRKVVLKLIQNHKEYLTIVYDLRF